MIDAYARAKVGRWALRVSQNHLVLNQFIPGELIGTRVEQKAFADYLYRNTVLDSQNTSNIEDDSRQRDFAVVVGVSCPISPSNFF